MDGTKIKPRVGGLRSRVSLLINVATGLTESVGP